MDQVFLTSKYANNARIKSLSMQEIVFSACENTIQNIEKKTGKTSTLTEGVTTVKSGVARIIELQEEGYSYIRP